MFSQVEATTIKKGTFATEGRQGQKRKEQKQNRKDPTDTVAQLISLPFCRIPAQAQDVFGQGR